MMVKVHVIVQIYPRLEMPLVFQFFSQDMMSLKYIISGRSNLVTLLHLHAQGNKYVKM